MARKRAARKSEIKTPKVHRRRRKEDESVEQRQSGGSIGGLTTLVSVKGGR
jgi:hypothetical protein